MQRPAASAFTLVEILVILLVLGLIAAVVVPRLTNASGTNRETSAQTTLRYLRDQISLFQSQHNNTPPQNGAVWTLLQRTSSPDETAVADPVGTELGPYFHANPVNPWNRSSNVSSQKLDPAAGWYYNAGPHAFELRVRNADGSINYQY